MTQVVDFTSAFGMMLFSTAQGQASRIKDEFWLIEPAFRQPIFFPAAVAPDAEAVDPGLVGAVWIFTETLSDSQRPVFKAAALF